MPDKYFSLSLLILALSRLLSIMPSFPLPIYYGGFACIGLYCILRSKAVRINISMLLFLICCILSIVLNDIPEFFSSEARLISFTLIIITIGPLFNSSKLGKLREAVFRHLMPILVLIVFISFIGYIIKMPGFVKYGLFYGITQQSMLLGPISAIAVIIALHSLLIVTNNSRFEKYIKISVIVICFLSCMLTGSRSSLGAMLISFLFYMSLYLRGNIKKFFKLSLVSGILILLTSPFWMPYTEAVMQKQKNNENAGGTFASRESLWEDRVMEFKSRPFTGVGFSSFDIDIARSNFSDSGQIEPGSGWLFLLSSIGIFATLLFANLLLKPIWYIFKLKNLSDCSLLGAILLFFLIHLFAEGYVLASGSVLFFLLWLFIGMAQKEQLKILYESKTDFLAIFLFKRKRQILYT